MTKRKRYSVASKARVALEAIREELTLADLAKKHGVHPNMISGWKRAAIENMATVFGKGSGSAAKNNAPGSRSCTPRSASLWWNGIF